MKKTGAPKIPSSQGKGKEKGLRRILTIATCVVGVALIAWLAFMLFGNNYKSNALKMKVNTMIASRLSNAILADYQDNWVRVETEQLGRNDEGVLVSTDDAGKVIKWRQEFFRKNGGAELLQHLKDDIDDNYKSLKLTPARYRETKDNFKNLQKDINELIAMTEQPGDSLFAFVARIKDLNDAIQKDLEPTDFNFWVSYDDVNLRVKELVGNIKDKDLVESLGKETDGAQNNVVNMLKYKKMGFKELPNGKGVLFHEITAGKGPKPKDDTKLVLHYEGKLMDGTIFDSSYKRGEPVTMRPSQTVPGFWHSLTNMKVGSKWEIYIPYAEAYGNRAAGAVKPYSDLFFTIEVLGIDNN